MIPIKDENPTETVPFVTVAIITTNILAFAYELSLGQEGVTRLVMEMGVVPREMTAGGLNLSHSPTFMTSMFLHGGLLHLLGNMLYLWIFGNNIEDALGHVRFVLFYLLCGVAATALHVALNSGSAKPVIGASGAISGVLGAYLILYPKARVWTIIFYFFLIRLIRVPAVVVLVIWILYQVLSAAVLSAYSTADAGGVAVFAHIGGFVAGIVLLPLFLLGRKRRGRIRV